MWQSSLLHILCFCWYIIFSLHCACKHLKLDHLLLDTRFLITHLNKGMLDCSRTFVRNQLFQYSLASASQLSCFPFPIQLLLSTRKPKPSWDRSKAALILWMHKYVIHVAWHCIYNGMALHFYNITMDFKKSVQLVIFETCNKLYGKKCSSKHSS